MSRLMIRPGSSPVARTKDGKSLTEAQCEKVAFIRSERIRLQAVLSTLQDALGIIDSADEYSLRVVIASLDDADDALAKLNKG